MDNKKALLNTLNQKGVSLLITKDLLTESDRAFILIQDQEQVIKNRYSMGLKYPLKDSAKILNYLVNKTITKKTSLFKELSRAIKQDLSMEVTNNKLILKGDCGTITKTFIYNLNKISVVV